MNEIAHVQLHSLPALIDRASSALANARSSAEILEARDMAGVIYDAAKHAARLLKAKDAHDNLIAAAYRAQADALEIESGAKRRLADEYDAAQDRGEIAVRGQPSNVPDGNVKPATAEELGLSRKQIHEARLIRDAEANDPGVVRRALDERIEAGDEPSKAYLRQVVLEAAERGMRGGYTPRAGNPNYKPNPSFDAMAAVTGSCTRIIEHVEKHGAAFILRGCLDDAMRGRSIATITECREALSLLLE